MILKSSEPQWEDDFREFIESEPSSPPAQITEKILRVVTFDLNPSPWLVFRKLAIAVSISGFLSLLVCPQLGFALSGSTPLMDIFMVFGPRWCTLCCGCFFMFLAVLVTSLTLCPQDLRVLRRYRFLQLSAITALMLGVFVSAGPGVLLGVALEWFIGAWVGGLLSLETGFALRSRLVFS